MNFVLTITYDGSKIGWMMHVDVFSMANIQQGGVFDVMEI